MRIGETPVPIPNTTVKTYPADDTAGATLWESRWPPNLKKRMPVRLVSRNLQSRTGLNNDRMQEAGASCMI